jgi:hypothetical protein
MVVILRYLSIVTESSQLCRQFRIVRGDHTSIAIRAKIFSRVKAKAACRAEGSARTAVVQCAVRLGSVLDDM